MTGLIYIVIIALWVAVLVPMWLRRHDQVSELRSTDQFKESMQRLSRAQAQAREASMAVHPAAQSPSRSMPRRDRDSASEAAMRRAMVLAGLSVILGVTLLLAIFGVVPMFMPIVSALLVVAFMVATAMTKPMREMRRETQRTPIREVEQPPIRVTPPARSRSSDEEWESWNAWDEDDDAWEAVPTTLPTYVSAPRASAVPRPIDKARPGEWTGEAMVETAREMRRREAEHAGAAAWADEVDPRSATAELPAIRVRPSRAVNE